MTPLNLPYLSCLLSLMSLLGCAADGAGEQAEDTPPSRIVFWYGAEQTFGHLGEPQRWINILGNIAISETIGTAVFSVNNGPERPLSLGSDLHRLARPGDFNIELAWNELREGSNHLKVIGYPSTGPAIEAGMQLKVDRGNTWPLPYAIDFAAINNLQEVVQVVDGHWSLEEDGVRTRQRYYDRVLSMGDTSWTDYETTVQLTVHDYTPSEPGAPTYNVTHFGLAMRWRGHHRDGRQPSRKWYPLGAQGEFLINEQQDSCRFRILFDGGGNKPPVYSDRYNNMVLGRPMFIKTQVATLADGRTRYRFKQWMAAAPEPASWDIEGLEVNDYPSGALCLVPHNSDVTIHSVQVEPLETGGER
jgi:hypothetical protein